MDAPTEYRILGPLEVNGGGQRLVVAGAKRRAVLAILLLQVGERVSVERLTESLWGEQAPDTAATAVYGHILALRKILGRDAIVTRDQGYELDVEPQRIDVQQFEQLLGHAKGLVGVERAALLDEALSLWRGDPLVDIDHEWFGAAEIARLHELRLGAVEDRVEIHLAAGRGEDLVPDLEAFVAAYPLRERLWEQLMRALYRSGRQADALHAYQRARHVLVRELGIDPGSALRRLEGQILDHDPVLDGPDEEVAHAGDVWLGAVPVEEPSVLERKFATALFADLVGSTALTEREDPEVVQSMLRRTFDLVAEVVISYGGTIENVMGDAVLAMFGVPTVHEDDPERAVRAALEMRAKLDALGDELAAEGKPALALHLGLEAGEVLVHSPPRQTRIITGDAVNTASRLQDSARPGCVVVGPTAYALTKGVIDYHRMPPIELKGKARPVQAWLALRPTGRTRDVRPSFGLESRLIGRDDEVSLLTHTFDRVISEGRPALVTVLGPAGVGKSRLALEFLQQMDARPTPPRWRKGRCRAYGNVSYSALVDAMKNHCGILDDDPVDAVAEKVGRAVEDVLGDRALVRHVEALVGAGSDHRFTREALFDAWRRLLERIAAQQPLVLVLEDIHWADDGLLDFIDHLADWGQGPLLVLTLARPELLERRVGWGGGKRNYAAIYLDPLTRDETHELLSDLLSTSLPEALTSVVFERAEGNPLFSEEIVRMLIDRGAIKAVSPTEWEVTGTARDVDVPRSIQALIAARLDALPPAEKAVLQTAAVVGRTFWLGAARRLSGRDEHETRDALVRLRAKELVVPREPAAFSGETEFAFRHVLIRDVAYESVPKSLRADKHMEVARWAEEQAGERREEIAELLASHCVEALRYLDELGENDNRRDVATRWSYAWARAAGERAMRLWEQGAALRWFSIALELAPRVGSPVDELASLWEAIARAREDIEPYPEVAHALEAALALYEEAGSQRDAGRVEARLAYVAHQRGDQAAVVGPAARALQRLEPLGDTADLASALHVLGWHEFRNTRYETAEEHLRRSMAIAERVADQTTQGHAMVSLAFVFQQTGRGPESVAMFETALDLARAAGDLPLLMRALTHVCGALEEFAGEYLRAEEYAREGLELARRAGNVGNVGWTSQMLSDLLLEMGRIEEAEAAVHDALSAARAVGETLVVGYALQRIAYLRALRADPDAAYQALTEARSIVGDNPEPWLRGWDPLIAGHVAQARGDHDDAARLLTDGAQRILDQVFVWGGKSLLLECVRALAGLDRPQDALVFRDRLAELGSTSVPARAFLAWADGLLASTPTDARERLHAAAAGLENLGHRIEFGRCLGDLAEAERRDGVDATSTRERALHALRSCGAELFVRELAAHGADIEQLGNSGGP